MTIKGITIQDIKLAVKSQEAHDALCDRAGITKMHPISYKIGESRQRAGHITYWLLKGNGFDNIDAEKHSAALLEMIGY